MSNRHTVHLRRVLAGIALTCSISSARPPLIPVDSSKDLAQGVYVRDSAVAVEKFALAQRMERLKEWAKAADVYQEMLTTQSDKVVAARTENDHITQYQSVITAVQQRLSTWPAEGLDVYRGRFETQASGLLEQAKADNRPEGVDDPALLHRVVTSYFVTDAAKTAGIRLIDLYLENGDFAAAAWTGQHLLSAHPQLLDDRAPLLFRTALANHFAGNDTLSKQQQAELAEKFPAALGKVRGTDAVLADALADALKQPVEAPAASSGESWPMPFGSADRSRVPTTSGGGGARMFKIDITDTFPKGASLPGPVRAQFKNDSERDRKSGLMTGIMPVVDAGELFFQDNTRVYAVSLESGLPLPGWQQTYGGERNGCYSITGWVTPRNQQETLCLTDDAVFAIMGQADSASVGLTNVGRNDTRLVCLDRHSGKLRWDVKPQQFPADPQVLRQLDMSGSPLVVGENVYLIGRGGRGMQFDDCYVVCLDSTSGQFKWARYLASANSAAQVDMEMVNGGGTDASHIAFSGGRLYITTNVGAVAAVDAYDGTIIWLNLYPRENDTRPLNMPQRWMQSNTTSPDGDKPWTCNPAIVKDGKVFVLPSDGKFVHIYDAGDGSEIKRIKMTGLGRTGLESADTLVGVLNDALVVASDRSIFSFDWPNYDPSKGINNLHWANSFSKTQYPNDSIRGRPFMTADSVFVPLAWAMTSISLRTGSTQFSYPKAGVWDEKEESPGNIVVTQDHLIVAGPQRLCVYTDLNVATAKLDAAIAAAPSDPAPRLRYAEILFVARHTPEAIAKLDEASALIHTSAPAASQPATGPATTQSVPSTPLLGTLGAVTEAPGVSSRGRLFYDALTFAQQLATTDTSEAGTKSAESLFDKASAAAATPAELVTYRLRRAEYAHQKIQTADELALYQSILSDPRLRGVTVASAENTASPAGSVARLQVSDLIQRAGPGVYQTYEQQARDQLETLRAQNTPDKPERLVAIAESYPNSTTARAAMLDAADAYETVGKPRASAALLRQFSSRYPDSPERIRAIESLARAYLEMPNRAESLNVAIGRLEQGKKLAGPDQLSRPLPLPDGTVLEHVTFDQAVDALRKFQSRAAVRSLPDTQIPTTRKPGVKPSPLLPEDLAATLGDVQALIPPLRDWARHDRVVVYATTGELNVYAVGAKQPLVRCAAIDEAPRNIAWIGTNLLVWCPSRLFLIRGEAAPATGTTTGPSGAPGEVIWDAPLRGLPVTQIASIGGNIEEGPAVAGADTDGVDGTDQPDVQPVLPNGQRIFIRGNGRVILGRGNNMRIIGPNGLIRIGQANPIPAVAPGAVEQIDRVVAGNDRVVFSTAGGAARGGRVVSLSMSDGKVQWQTRSEDHTIDQLLANDDFVVIRASDDNDARIAAFDAQSGQPVWRPRTFGRENNDAGVPINCALSEDGSLVYVLADHVCCKDLFDPDPKLRFDHSVTRNPGANPANTFIGAAAPDQLLISDGRILVVTDNGTFVRLYSLFSGSPVKISADSEGILGTQVVNDPWNAHMRVVGNQLYVLGRDRVMHYNLNNIDDNCAMSNTVDRTTITNRDVVVTRDFLVTIANVVPGDRQVAGEQEPKSLQVKAYSRLVFNGRESGMNVGTHTLNEPSGIGQLQVVDGGIVYSTGDHKLHLLRGNTLNPN